jgi:hypothetical protein
MSNSVKSVGFKRSFLSTSGHETANKIEFFINNLNFFEGQSKFRAS